MYVWRSALVLVTFVGLESPLREGALAYDDDIAVNQIPLIMSHDAASGYLTDHGLINRWTKTQSVGMKEQLECGARVFDARPELHDSKGLVWHHGDVTVDYQFSQSVTDIKSWTATHPTELVIMNIWDCVGGDACMDAVVEVLTAAGVPIMDSCAALSEGLTLGGLKSLAQTADASGLLLANTAPDNCANSNYDETLACSGFVRRQIEAEEKDGRERGDEEDAALSAAVERCLESVGANDPMVRASELTQSQLGTLIKCADALDTESFANASRATDLFKSRPTYYNCYQGSSTQSYPLGRMMAYLDGVSEAGPNKDGTLAQHQALWEETALSVVLGTLAGSSLVKDEQWSTLNGLVTAAVQEGRWGQINLLEVNDVCDGGYELLAALQAM